MSNPSENPIHPLPPLHPIPQTQPSLAKILVWVFGSCLAVSLLIIAMLVALLLPAISSARNTAQQMQFHNYGKQIGLSMLNYETAYGHFPPAYTTDESGKPLHSWRVLLLPFMERQDLYEKIHLDEPWDSEWNSQFHHQMPLFYGDPRNKNLEPGMTPFAVVVGEETMFPPEGKTTKISDLRDGSSNTLMVTTRQPVCWMDPSSDISFEKTHLLWDQDPNGMASFRGIGLGIFADGSVLTLSTKDLSPEIIQALLILNDGKEVSLPE